jgi:hypothetical protein
MWLKGATQQLLHNDLKMGTKKYPADHSGQGAVFYKMDLFFLYQLLVLRSASLRRNHFNSSTIIYLVSFLIKLLTDLHRGLIVVQLRCQ